MKRAPRRNLKIEDCWLYAIASPADLARRLSTRAHILTESDLEKFSRDAGNYKLFTLKQGSRKRDIQQPKPPLQRIHLRIHELLSRVEVPKYLHSAVKGKSYISNADAHMADTEQPTVKIDIKKFFASVPADAILKFFLETMRCRRDAARILADLLSFNARLPTGSSASPIISYYAYKPMFDAIERLAASRSLTMTCYVDDMTFSGPTASRSVVQEARKIIAGFGLKSHKAKSFSASSPKVITGVCLTANGKRVPNKLHLKIKQGFEAVAAAQTPSEKLKAANPLMGRLEAAGQIDPTFKARATTLRAKLRSEQHRS